MPLKAWLPMFVRTVLEERSIEVKAVLMKALLPIVWRLEGKLTDVKEYAPEKAGLSMLVMAVQEARSTELRPVFWKACCPIVCRLDGKLIETKAAQLRKA